MKDIVHSRHYPRKHGLYIASVDHADRGYITYHPRATFQVCYTLATHSSLEKPEEHVDPELDTARSGTKSHRAFQPQIQQGICMEDIEAVQFCSTGRRSRNLV